MSSAGTAGAALSCAWANAGKADALASSRTRNRNIRDETFTAEQCCRDWRATDEPSIFVPPLSTKRPLRAANGSARPVPTSDRHEIPDRRAWEGAPVREFRQPLFVCRGRYLTGLQPTPGNAKTSRAPGSLGLGRKSPPCDLK